MLIITNFKSLRIEEFLGSVPPDLNSAKLAAQAAMLSAIGILGFRLTMSRVTRKEPLGTPYFPNHSEEIRHIFNKGFPFTRHVSESDTQIGIFFLLGTHYLR